MKINQNNFEIEKLNFVGYLEINNGIVLIDDVDYFENIGFCKGGINEIVEEGKKLEKGKKYRIK